ncbi:MAG: LytTR family DNA-binding domain-containing protein [Lachnospiraceae bacterium]|nr:LytTR family DNA-binding domain-containing protein [Lachnospiraceae bacterium]MDD7627461.1 LytTR family DNA-binding domain-containing protein [Lachnospiraceae bacterium]MDY4119573.1 LytTR family DNA-binding domain-containing protein [Lachnospiraceae bacterium]
MYKIAICDDDKQYIEYLKAVISENPIVIRQELLFYDFYSGEQLFLYPTWDFDLVIIDIQMQGMDGYETAMKLREVDHKFLLIFCSGTVNPTSLFFKACPYRYLLKSYSYDEMQAEITEIVSEMKRKKNYPFVMCKYSSGKDQIKVYPESILYIAIRNESSEIFAYGRLKAKYPNATLRLNQSLDALEKIFNQECGFVRAHNSYIVNMEYIIFANPHEIKMIDGTQLSVSRSRSKEFQRIFAEYISAKYIE